MQYWPLNSNNIKATYRQTFNWNFDDDVMYCYMLTTTTATTLNQTKFAIQYNYNVKYTHVTWESFYVCIVGLREKKITSLSLLPTKPNIVNMKCHTFNVFVENDAFCMLASLPLFVKFSRWWICSTMCVECYIQSTQVWKTAKFVDFCNHLSRQSFGLVEMCTFFHETWMNENFEEQNG